MGRKKSKQRSRKNEAVGPDSGGDGRDFNVFDDVFENPVKAVAKSDDVAHEQVPAHSQQSAAPGFSHLHSSSTFEMEESAVDTQDRRNGGLPSLNGDATGAGTTGKSRVAPIVVAIMADDDNVVQLVNSDEEEDEDMSTPGRQDDLLPPPAMDHAGTRLDSIMADIDRCVARPHCHRMHAQHPLRPLFRGFEYRKKFYR